ncbi:hypothetical protein L6452_14016 [Arctium lappa]|uniref:Uncharacterized protein n=1 Tax=Arctium lappa TaxID=4217 RepID=A0ACB9CJU4_ARCLA|nr:hypothetical protein L6452_14016 [Arctium lappa]
MHKSSLNYASSTNPPPPSSSSSSSPSPSHSSITTHSLFASSSIDSFSSSQSPSPSRCFGLNLLVKAIHQVTAGSVVGVPYIQRRNLTRRRRPLQFNNLILTTTELLSKSGSRSESKSKAKRQRRVNITMPSKYRDSVLQPLTPKLRTERSSSVKIIGE